MNLIEKTKELAEFVPFADERYGWAAKHQSENGCFEVNLVGLRDAAPSMLRVLGAFQPGDAEMLQEILRDFHEREEFPGQAVFATNALKRLQAAAVLMEADVP